MMPNNPPVELVAVHDEQLEWTADDLQNLLATTKPEVLPDVKRNFKLHNRADGIRPVRFLGLLPQRPGDLNQYVLRMYRLPYPPLHPHAFREALTTCERYEQELISLGKIALQNGLPELILPHSTFLASSETLRDSQVVPRYMIVPFHGDRKNFHKGRRKPRFRDIQLRLGATLLQYFEMASDEFLTDISEPYQFSFPDGTLYDYDVYLQQSNLHRAFEINNVMRWMDVLAASPERDALLAHGAALQASLTCIPAASLSV